jgi:hypothetical protein
VVPVGVLELTLAVIADLRDRVEGAEVVLAGRLPG